MRWYADRHEGHLELLACTVPAGGKLPDHIGASREYADGENPTIGGGEFCADRPDAVSRASQWIFLVAWYVPGVDSVAASDAVVECWPLISAGSGGYLIRTAHPF